MKAMKTATHMLLRTLVGAPGFEPGASCAQGRRATRLRYAPTDGTALILLYSWIPLPVGATTTVPKIVGAQSSIKPLHFGHKRTYIF
jgi:hypothetical protein